MEQRLPATSFQSLNQKTIPVAFSAPDLGFVPVTIGDRPRSTGVVNHGKRLEVDENASISQLLLRISQLEATVLWLTNLLGVGPHPEPLDHIDIGVWRIGADGNDLVKKIDINLSSGARNWVEKERDLL